MQSSLVVLWSYIALLVLGGAIGMIKAGSKASLIMSVAFAIPLTAVALGILPMLVAQVDIGFLFVFFAVRYAKTKKVMPGGGMALLSLITLIALLALQKRG